VAGLVADVVVAEPAGGAEIQLHICMPGLRQNYAYLLVERSASTFIERVFLPYVRRLSPSLTYVAGQIIR